MALGTSPSLAAKVLARAAAAEKGTVADVVTWHWATKSFRGGIIWDYIGIMEKKMETTIL